MSSPRPRAAALSVIALAFAVAVVFTRLAETEPTISDPIGYLYAGERLAASKGPTYEDEHNTLAGPYFSLYAFQVRRPDSTTQYLGFPPGFSLLLAAAARLSGASSAMHAVVPLLAAWLLLMTYTLGRLLTNNTWVGFWSATALLITPAFWQFGTAAWSEIPSTAFIVTGTCAYLWTRKALAPSRWNRGLSVMGGVILGFGAFIRYTSAVLALPIAAHELYTARTRIIRDRWRWWFFIALGLSFVFLLIFNHYYYGGITLTSYSPEHGWYPLPPFSLRYAFGPSFADGHSAMHIARTLWDNFTVLLFLLPFGIIRLAPAARLLVVLSILVSIFVYAVYAFAATGINSRFLLPTFPFLAVAIAAGLTGMSDHVRELKWKWVGGAILFLLAIGTLMPTRVDALRERNNNNAQTVANVMTLSAGLQADAVILSYDLNDLLRYYAGRSVLNYRRIPPSDAKIGAYHFEVMEPCLVQTVDRLLALKNPVYYIPTRAGSIWDVLPILERNYVFGNGSSEAGIIEITDRLPSTEAIVEPCPTR
jgi:4-amino-4-deoxy-L-arabinose transferase-like glycosyltransferase